MALETPLLEEPQPDARARSVITIHSTHEVANESRVNTGFTPRGVCWTIASCSGHSRHWIT